MRLFCRSCVSHDERLSKVAYRRNGAGQILVSRQKNGARPERPSAANRLVAMEEKEMVTKKPRHPVALLAPCCAGTPNQRPGEALRTSQRRTWLSRFLGIARQGLDADRTPIGSQSVAQPLSGGLVQLAHQRRGTLP